MKFDLTVYAFETHQPRLLCTASAGKGAARGREEDSLIIKLWPSDAVSLSDEVLNQTLSKLAAAFFKTGGSVTNAMRGLADGLNKTFLSGNSQLQDKDSWQTASLLMGVVHHETLFIGINGKAEALLVRKNGREHLFDAELDPRGLGLSSVVHPRFFQTSVADGDFMLLAQEIPADLLASERLKADTASLGEFVPLLGGVDVIRLTYGEGLSLKARLEAKAPPEIQETTETEDKQGQPEAAEAQELEWPEEVLETPELEEENGSLAEDLFRNVPLVSLSTIPETKPETQPEEPAVAPVEPEIIPEEPVVETKNAEEAPSAPIFDGEQFKTDALHSVAKGAGILKSVDEKIETIFQKSREKKREEGKPVTELSALSKWLIAILVPLLLVGLTTFIYLSQGQGKEYSYFLAQAEASANNAALMQTDELKREVWNQTIEWLDKAAAYQKSEEVNALYLRARLALDELDGAKRLIYKPAFAAGLFPDMSVSNIISLNRDLYLLDQTSGEVRHLTLQSQGYSLDEAFRCGPGSIGGVQVGKLVDMLAIPINNPAKAPILAIDAAGNLLYCAVGSNPTAAILLPPDGGWQELKSIAFDAGKLLVLDSAANAIWIYRGFSSNFDQVPVSYFDAMPVKLQEAVDLAVSKDELFLLHADGHSSHCLASQISGSVTCEDPYPYQDAVGGGAGVDLASLKFNQMAYSPPPDPSIYFLEPETAELYQFSLRLNLNQVLRPGLSDGSLPTAKATAFAVAANRQVFLAFGNAVYYAILP
ncbi:MAG TPA: hypothetical protein PLO13_05600 [Anaerolineaceae bacterium]|nr:hypothetical protein [Anaerolineaceae bacterium]